MTRYIAIALMSTTLAGVPLLTGCDNDKATKSSQTETKNPDGSSSVDKSKTTVDSKGDEKTTTEHKVTAPTTQP